MNTSVSVCSEVCLSAVKEYVSVLQDSGVPVSIVVIEGLVNMCWGSDGANDDVWEEESANEEHQPMSRVSAMQYHRNLAFLGRASAGVIAFQQLEGKENSDGENH